MFNYLKESREMMKSERNKGIKARVNFKAKKTKAKRKGIRKRKAKKKNGKY